MALGGQRPRGPMLAGSFLVRQSQQLDWLAGLFILWPFQAIPQAPSSLIFVLLFPLPQFLFLEGKTKLIFGSGWHRVTSDSFTRFRSEFFFFFFPFPVAVQQAGVIYGHVCGLAGPPESRPFSLNILLPFTMTQWGCRKSYKALNIP